MAGNVIAIRETSSGAELLETIEDYFADVELAATSVTVYSRTFEALVEDLGSDVLVESIERVDIDRFLKQRWGKAAPSTYNRNRAALSSFFSWCEDVDLITRSPARKLRRRKEKRTVEAERLGRAIPYLDLEAIWSDKAHHLRDRTFWAMAYDTSARAEEILGINIEQLDRPNKTGIVIGKGGSAETVAWASTTARLLPHLIGDRTQGPLFLTHRLPRSHVTPAASDTCPTTGRARLSYRRAAELFDEASNGRTLHQLRHASLTHYAEDGATLMELKAKSRHSSTRSLERYVNPSINTIKELTDRHDPNRRTKRRN